jgi:hypothetical protein
MVIPTSNLSPNMPSAPGEPGFILILRNEIRMNPPWSLVYKGLIPGEALFRYLGEYEGRCHGKMSAESFLNQQLVICRFFFLGAS